MTRQPSSRTCGTCGGKLLSTGVAVEQVRHVAVFTALEIGYLVHADLARYLRRYLGLTQAELAAKMGMERVTVARWENGENGISPQNDYVLRGIAREHLKAQLVKPWARTLDAKFRHLPDVFLEGVRTDPPPKKSAAAVKPVAIAIAKHGA